MGRWLGCGRGCGWFSAGGSDCGGSFVGSACGVEDWYSSSGGDHSGSRNEHTVDEVEGRKKKLREMREILHVAQGTNLTSESIFLLILFVSKLTLLSYTNVFSLN